MEKVLGFFDYIILFCDAVALSVGTLSVVVATSCICRLLFGRELFFLDAWYHVRLVVDSRNGRTQRCLCKKSSCHDYQLWSFWLFRGARSVRRRESRRQGGSPLTGAWRLPVAPMRASPCATSGDTAGWGWWLMAAEQNACVIVASTPRIEWGKFLTPER